MSLTRFCFAGLLFLACGDAIAQVDEALIDDLPQTRKETEQARPKPRKTKDKLLPGDGGPPRAAPYLIDDLSPEQKRAAAERAEERKIENAIPDTLAEALARALHNSPEIVIADAKVRQSQAELNEVRQSVVHDLTLAFKRWSRYKEMVRKEPKLADAQIGQKDETFGEAILEDEARIIYLLGVAAESPARMYLKSEGPPNGPGSMSASGAGGMSASGAGGMSPMGMMPGSMMPGSPGSLTPGKAAAKHAQGDVADSNAFDKLPENVRDFLNKRVDLDFAQQPLEDVLAYVQQAAACDVDFVLQNPDVTAADALGPPVTILVKKATVAAALQALADLNGSAFIFRDYGILVIGPKDNGRSLESYRSSGALMIAPPEPTQRGGGGMMGGPMAPGMGLPMGGPGPRQ